MPTAWIVVAGAAVGLLALFTGVRAHLTRTREGKMLAFVTLFLLPLVAVGLGFNQHMEQAETRTFCVSCHVMQDYGRSLYIDDPSFVPAKHFQNNLVPREYACYTCHTNYTMFGPIEAKMHGLRHLWVQYFGTVPKPEDIKLYTPYDNQQCLHCHLGQRRFEEGAQHRKTPDLMQSILSGQKSCVSSGCHEFIHNVGDLKDATFWKEKQ